MIYLPLLMQVCSTLLFPFFLRSSHTVCADVRSDESFILAPLGARSLCAIWKDFKSCGVCKQPDHSVRSLVSLSRGLQRIAMRFWIADLLEGRDNQRLSDGREKLTPAGILINSQEDMLATSNRIKHKPYGSTAKQHL